MKMKLLPALALCALFTTTNAQDANWMAKAKSRIEQKQHAFKMLAPGRFAAISPSQNSSYNIRRDAYEVKAITGENRMSVTVINAKGASPERIYINEKGQLNYQFAKMQIQYENNQNGLRQNFILQERPTEPISLEFNTKLKTVLNENFVQFKDENNRTVLAYDELKVFDADGKILTASFVRKSDHIVAIQYNDAGARYPITVDPLNHAPNWTDSGNGLLFPLLDDATVHTLFGFSVSAAGDLNNDGYDDIVIGAPGYVDIINISNGNFNVANVGAAFVYKGSSDGPSIDPSEVLQPTTELGALFGFSVTNAGDLNHDGYDDLAVGAPADKITLTVGLGSASVAVGKVYVYRGSANFFDGSVTTEPTVNASISLSQSDFGTLLLPPANPLFGFSVAGLGHSDNNSSDNLAIGIPAYTGTLLRQGRVAVYDGNNLSTPQASISGSVLNGLFGYSVSSAGNVNGDNLMDMIVGAPADLTILGVGNAYVFHGTSNGMSSVQATLNSGGLTSTLFGYSVTNAGDLNKDGYGDVAVGEPAALETFASSLVAVGAVKVFYGSSTGINPNSRQTIYSPRRPSLLGLLSGNLLFGFSVSSTGDMNCDGYDDLIIGEPGGTALSLFTGLLGLVSVQAVSGNAYLYSGSPTGVIPTPFYTVNETASVSIANLIGYSVSEAGDVNGDGRPDILIGAPNGTLDLANSLIGSVTAAVNFITSNSIGSAYVYYGCLSASNSPLPVKLTSFEARAQKSDVLLTWRSETEDNTRHYEIEQSKEGQPYRIIGLISARGSGNSYSFTDVKPGSKNLYRLKMVDLDGSFSYSPIRSVEFDAMQQIMVYPNPARSELRLRLMQSSPSLDIKLVNSSGVIVWRKTVNSIDSSNEIIIPRNQLPAGQYVLVANETSRKIQFID